jgi:hypothetical protein
MEVGLGTLLIYRQNLSITGGKPNSGGEASRNFSCGWRWGSAPLTQLNSPLTHPTSLRGVSGVEPRSSEVRELTRNSLQVTNPLLQSIW